MTTLSSHKHQKHAAAVIKHRKILSSAVNSGNKTNPRAVAQNSLVDKLHAEMAAIYLCSPSELKGATLVIAREKSRFSKPCDRCMGLIGESGIKSIIYSTPSGFVKENV